MHGLGNDFVIVDGISQSFNLNRTDIKNLGSRHLGIGFDQLLLIKPSTQADFACEIFNSDGSVAEQCGNGMRCVARFVHEEKLTDKKSFSIETKAGIVNALIKDYDHIQVNMGVPRFEPSDVPYQADRIRKLYELPLDDGQPGFAIAVLSMGNPHAILQVSSIKNFPVSVIAPQIALHRFFPQGANVGFMEILNAEHIKLRTFERGVGETFACGSNACAAVVAGILNNSLKNKVKVELAYGDLWIQWEGLSEPVFMTGPATRVFTGKVT